MSLTLKNLIKIWSNELEYQQKIMTGSGVIIVSIMLFLAVFSPYIVPYNPNLIDLRSQLDPPSYEHLFGTDHLGRDVLSRTLVGARISFSVATFSILVTLTIATPLGLLAAYYGGSLDSLLTLIMDSLYVFPGIILAILFSSLLGQTPFLIGLAVSISSIPSFYRVIHSITISSKERTFVEVTRSSGASNFYILKECIFPQVAPSIMSLASMTYGRAILSIASLGFLGLGISPPIPEWGTELAMSREFLTTGAWWNIFFPGFAIVLSTWGFLTVGEALNDFINPRLRKR